MALFGVGYSGQRKPLDTVIVLAAEDDQLPRDAAFYQQFMGAGVNILAITTDAEAARKRYSRRTRPDCGSPRQSR